MTRVRGSLERRPELPLPEPPTVNVPDVGAEALRMWSAGPVLPPASPAPLLPASLAPPSRAFEALALSLVSFGDGGRAERALAQLDASAAAALAPRFAAVRDMAAIVRELIDTRQQVSREQRTLVEA